MRYRLTVHRHRRVGAALVELALLLPFLLMLFVAAVDFARVFYFALTIANCARNGALYASDPVTQAQSPYASTQAAALADASNINPAPAVTSNYGTDGSGNAYVDVTVTYPFQTITAYPLVPDPLTLSRTTRMRMAPVTPNFN